MTQAIPGRMTVAQLREMISGACAVATGCTMREFTYDETGHEELLERLCSAGLQQFYDPLTGQPLPNKLFTPGGCYYSRLAQAHGASRLCVAGLRLRHYEEIQPRVCSQVSEKVRANDIIGGEINPITRQSGGWAQEQRRREGGRDGAVVHRGTRRGTQTP